MDLTYRPNRTPLVAPGEIDHHVADMTATVGADVTLAKVQATLAVADQWLPIDGDPGVPVGRLVEVNSSGPLRLGYGHWRDLLLGAQFTNGRDELITAGGRTMKNVAGYDLTKFMVGQHGVFGKLVTITARTYRRPAGAILATFPPRAELVGRLLPSPQRPQWMLLTAAALLCGYVGDERSLAYHQGTLAAEWKPVALQRRTLEEDVEHRAALWTGRFRASVPPARVGAFVSAAQPMAWVADAAFGIVVGEGDDQMIRLAATKLNGTVFFSSATAAEKPHLTFDVPPGPQRDLLERLKQSFDPDGRLAPLPWTRRS